MSKLHKSPKNIGENVESKEGERGLLCSNKANERSPSLNFSDNDLTEEQRNLAGVFSILFETYKRLYSKHNQPIEKENESNNSSQSIR